MGLRNRLGQTSQSCIQWGWRNGRLSDFYLFGIFWIFLSIDTRPEFLVGVKDSLPAVGLVLLVFALVSMALIHVGWGTVEPRKK